MGTEMVPHLTGRALVVTTASSGPALTSAREPVARVAVP